jgi:hypothetical protein
MVLTAGPGFIRKIPVLAITWPADHELHGLIIRCKTISMGTYLEAAELGSNMSASTDPSVIADTYRKAASIMSDSIIGWNLQVSDPCTEELQSPPHSAEGILSLDSQLQQAILAAWFEALGRADAPLGKGSPGGEMTDIPMLPLEAQ